MKIKHLKEHDEIVQWILNNPEMLLKGIGLLEPFTDLKKHIQVSVKNNNTNVGIFDVILRYEFINDEYLNTETGFRKQIMSVNIIVNVKLESATEQLREFKKIFNQHKENNSGNHYHKQSYVIVSTNDTFKSFFTDNNFIFYKY